MQFIDLKRQLSEIREQVDQNIQNVLEHGRFIMGPEIQELEQKLADFVGVKHCVSCSSGTDALLLPLLAWGVGPGDAILTTPFTFIATAEVIELLGATSVFVDIDPKTYNIDPLKLEETIHQLISKGQLTPKGIIPVDLFGLPCNYDVIQDLAAKYDLWILEDAAQGFGGEFKGQRAGSFGTAAATSFFPAKPLGCYGDGGAVFTNDDELRETMVSVRVHGQGSNKYDNVRIGLNARMDSIQAGILLAKLAIFEGELDRRNQVAGWYSERLQNHLVTPDVPSGYRSAWAQYSVMANNDKQRAYIQNQLKSAGIPSAIYYIKPLHLQDAFTKLGYQQGDFPISENCSQRIFSLPMHPYITEEEVDQVCQVIIDAL